MATCSVCCYVLGVFLLFFKIYFMLCVLFLGPGGAFVKQNFTAMVDACTSIISCLNLNRYCSEISEKHELTYSSVCVGTWWWWKNDLVYFLSMTEGIYRDT